MHPLSEGDAAKGRRNLKYPNFSPTPFLQDLPMPSNGPTYLKGNWQGILGNVVPCGNAEPGGWGVGLRANRIPSVTPLICTYPTLL